MHYYNLIIYLLETLCAVSGHAVSDRDVQQTLIDAKIRMETLLRLYYLRHGFELYDIFMVHFLSFLGFMHLEALKYTKPAEVEGRRSTLALAAKGLQQQGQSYYLATVVLRILKLKIGVEAWHLLRDVGYVEDENEDRQALMAEQVHSSWPIDIVGITSDPERQRLGNLVKNASKSGT